VLTPIAKSWSTDMGVEVASLGVQVHGGMGFVEEGGAAQFYRDARIAPIYEGANGIQAIDLYGRKLLGDRGETMRRVIDMAREAAGQSKDARVATHLGDAANALETATDYMLAAARDDALAGASAYLTLAGDVVGGMLLARGVAKTGDAAQSAVLSYYADTLLSRAGAHLPLIKLTAAPLAALG